VLNTINIVSHCKDCFLKKTIYILFTITFTVITLGFTVNKHYSGGELFSVALFSEPESCCEDFCSCCDEEAVTIQFRADYTFSIDTFEPSAPEMELFAFTIDFTISEQEIVLTEARIIDQDLPPPDNHSALSFYQSFLL